jgi:hypothetical protein
MPSASTIPSDFPNAHRLGDAALFRELLGALPKSTFSHLLARGLLPAAEKKLGRRNRWYETTMAKAVKALPAALCQAKASTSKHATEGHSHAAL